MRIIRPVTIEDSWIGRGDLETNVYEGVCVAPGYSAAATYPADAIVFVPGTAVGTTAGSDVYISLAGGNQGNSPTAEPSWWSYLYTVPCRYDSSFSYTQGSVCIDWTAGNENIFPVYESVYSGIQSANALSNTTYWNLVCYTAGIWYDQVGYSRDNFAVDMDTHRIYQCVATAPQGTEDPPTSIATYEANPGGETSYWIDYSASDLYKLVDGVVGTSGSVTREGNLTFNFTPTTDINSIGFINITGYSITISVPDASYEETKPLTVIAGGDSDIVTDWYSYFFSETRLIRNLVYMDVPGTAGNEITISIDIGEGANVELGEIIVGRYEELGVTQFAPEFSIIDYSRKSVDAFGNYTIVERAYSKKVNIRTIVPNYRIGPIYDLLTDIRATPVLWVPTEVEVYDESVLIYGFYKDFKMVIPHSNWAEMDLQIEGLT